MKKIFHIASRFTPHVGGLENMVLDLAQEQGKGNDVSVLTLDSGLRKIETEEMFGIKIYRYPAFATLSQNYLWPKSGFCERFAKRDFDIVFTHTRFFITSFLAGRVAKKMGKKWIHVEHGANFFQAKNIFVRILARIFDETFGKWVLKNADKVVVLTKDGERFVNRLGRKENVFLIPNGVRIFPAQGAFPRKNKALFLGRATAEKGIYELLEAAKECPEWGFSIVGENSSNLENTKNVYFYGELSRDKVRQKITKSSLLLSPSLGEGFGLTVLEAAVLSRPILATAVGIAPEILDAEFLIPMENGKVLTKKIQELTGDFERMERVGKKNFERAKKFNLEKMAKGYEKIII